MVAHVSGKVIKSDMAPTWWNVAQQLGIERGSGWESRPGGGIIFHQKDSSVWIEVDDNQRIVGGGAG
jgi:hypothetical protein